MTLAIPVWLLWTIGGLLALVIVALAVVGIIALRHPFRWPW